MIKENYCLVKLQLKNDLKESITHDFRLKKINYLTDLYEHNKFENFLSTNKEQLIENLNNYSNTHKKNRTTNDFIVGLIAVSHEFCNVIKDMRIDEINKFFIDSLNDIKEFIENVTNSQITIFYSAIHYDEKTPHMHFTFNNIDQYGYSIYNNIKRSKKLKYLQDVCELSFKSIGFVRGIANNPNKTSSKLKVREMHDYEKKENKEIINSLNNQIIAENNRYDSLYKELYLVLESNKKLSLKLKKSSKSKFVIDKKIIITDTLEDEISKLDDDIEAKLRFIKFLKTQRLESIKKLIKNIQERISYLTNTLNNQNKIQGMQYE